MSDPQFSIVKPNLAIDGIVTAKMKDGSHHTYQLKTVTNGNLGGKRIASLLTGSDNTSNYTAFAFIGKDWYGLNAISLWRRNATPVYEGHQRVLLGFDKEVESYLQSGYCMKCGRLLTDPISIEKSMGPTCRGER